MSRFGQQLLSYFLLLCLAVTVIPVNLLHHHEEAVHEETLGACLEVDVCHTADHNGYGIQQPTCDHKAHYDEQHMPCEFCKFKTASRDKYLSNSGSVHILSQDQEAVSISGRDFPSSYLSGVIFSRRPPA